MGKMEELEQKSKRCFPYPTLVANVLNFKLKLVDSILDEDDLFGKTGTLYLVIEEADDVDYVGLNI